MVLKQRFSSLQSLLDLAKEENGNLGSKLFCDKLEGGLYDVLQPILDVQAKRLNVSQLSAVLSEEIDSIAIKQQVQLQNVAIKQGDITRGKERLPENKRKKFANERSWENIIQLTFSSPEYFAYPVKKPEDFVVIPSKITPLMKQRLGIVRLDPDCRNFKEALLHFQPLQYQDEEKTKTTDRMGSISGIPVTTQVYSTIFDVVWEATHGEKRKRNYHSNIHMYDNVYSLLRGQVGVLDTIEENNDLYATISEQIQELFEPVFASMAQHLVDTRDIGVRQQLQDIYRNISRAKSFFVVASKIYQFQKISGKNISIDNKLLQGGYNRIEARKRELLQMTIHIGKHLSELEGHVHHHEKALVTMIADLYSLFYLNIPKNKVIPYDDINSVLIRYFISAKDKKHPLPMKPFSDFYFQLAGMFGPLSYEKPGTMKESISLKNPIMNEKQLFALELAFLSIAIKFEASRLSHQLSLSQTNVPPFADLKDKLHYNKYKELFASAIGDSFVKNELAQMLFPNFDQHILELHRAGDNKEKVCAILKQMQ